MLSGCTFGFTTASATFRTDEVVLKINGKRHWLWRAVDQKGVVLDILV